MLTISLFVTKAFFGILTAKRTLGYNGTWCSTALLYISCVGADRLVPSAESRPSGKL